MTSCNPSPPHKRDYRVTIISQQVKEGLFQFNP